MATREKEKRKGGGLVGPPPRPYVKRPFPVAPPGRKWLKIDAKGNSQVVATDRHKLTHELGVQARDLRILDPKFSTNYPSAILCREKALVVNLLHIKAILTTEYVLVTDPEVQDGELDPFVRELETRLSHQDITASASFPVLSNFMGHKKTSKNGGGSRDAKGKEARMNEGSDNQSDGGNDRGQEPEAPMPADPPVMPFELKALEICLESICTIMDANTTQLEGTAFPAVDDLTFQINTKNLQRVRSVKSKIAQHRTRVETVKEILEKFLDDDEDMRDMNLTAKQLLRRSLPQDDDAFGNLMREPTLQAPLSPRSSTSTNSSEFDEAVQEVEMLLETYFMQLDHIFNRLTALNEYIDDTEDFINIVQDKHRNQLLQLDLIITAGTFALTIVAVVSGIFGMNLDNSLPSESFVPFILVTCVSLTVACMVVIAIVWFCRLKGLMNI